MGQTEPAVRTLPASTRLLILGGFVPLAFVVVILIEGGLRAGYDPLHHFGSELSLSGRGWVQITNFVVAGIGTVAFALAHRRVVRDGPGARAFPVLTAIVGIGLVNAGVFVTDPHPGYLPGAATLGESTWHGWLHDANIVPVWLALTAAIAVQARRALRLRARAWAAVSMVAAVATPATMMVAMNLYDADSLSGSYHGLWQRISMAIAFGWYAALAVRLRQGVNRPMAS